MRYKKIFLVAGARPNFVKIAPIIRAIAGLRSRWRTELFLVHTGQHYDYELSKVFFEQLDIPTPDVYLGVGGGTHAQQTAGIMVAFEKILIEFRPDLVIVVGDVNSTLACALTAHKLQIEVAHVEAGLRSFDKTMPEEANRVLTDHISDYLFTPSPDADENLLREGISIERIFNVGNVMIDTLKANLYNAMKRPLLRELRIEHATGFQPYVIVTLHRPSNVDSRIVFEGIMEALADIARSVTVLWPMHPRTRKNIDAFGFDKFLCKITQPLAPGLYALDPLGYLDFINAMMRASAVVTDSGGIQEETTFLGVPCLTIRNNTERPITITMGTNRMAGVDPAAIKQSWEKLTITDPKIMQENAKTYFAHKCSIPKWDGKAAQRIVRVLSRTSFSDG